MTKIYDTIIVGAGYAGLTAGHYLKKAGKEIKILEARDRVGGRVLTEYLDKETYLDLGGQWIGPTQDKIYDLAKEFQVETFPTYNSGKSIVAFDHKIKTYKGLIPKISIFSLLSLNSVMKKLNKMSEKIDVENPWNSPNAAYLDEMTLATFLRKEVRQKGAIKVLNAGLETVFACKTSEISLLFALFYIKSGTSLECLFEIDKGAQQDRFIGGAQLIANRMAEQMSEEVQLNAAVRRVVQDESIVTVSGNDFSYQSKKVIIAIPPTLAGRIDYQPILPARRDQMTQRIPMGTVIKCYAIYAEPFWRTEGFSGLAVTDENFHVQTVFDNSPKDGKKGMLMGFSLANRARPLLELSESERKVIILKDFVRLFGEKAANPIQYIDKSWASEEWSRGCYTGVLPPGALTGYTDALRRPCGHIHWAGTETASIWNGYIDGAVRSGERAANEVLNI